jgi:hypothetical protein
MYTTKDKADVAATIFEWQLIKKTGGHRTAKTNNARLRGGGGVLATIKYVFYYINFSDSNVQSVPFSMDTSRYMDFHQG